MEANSVGTLGAFLDEHALREQPKEQQLGRDEFLKLLVAQLENQDPLSPSDNGEFVAQLAQFSSLEEAQKLSKGFENFTDTFMSSQHLQATSMVGRPVHVESEVTLLGNEGAISILADMPGEVADASLSVYDEAGALVDNFNLGSQNRGRAEFVWTGEDANGQRFPPGVYRFEVQVNQGEELSSLPTFLSSNVNSVTIEPGGALTLNLAGIGPTPISEVIQIN